MLTGILLVLVSVIGAAVLSLLAMAGAATTLATTNSQAQSPNDALCGRRSAPLAERHRTRRRSSWPRGRSARTRPPPAAPQQDAEPDGAEAEGPDTDNVELECGDQNEQDERESDVSSASGGQFTSQVSRSGADDPDGRKMRTLSDQCDRAFVSEVGVVSFMQSTPSEVEAREIAARAAIGI